MIINTIHGEMDDSELEHREGTIEDSEKILKWTEYWFNDELVHRSVHVHLKQGIDFGLAATSLV